MAYSPEHSFDLPPLPPSFPEEVLSEPGIAKLIVQAHRSIGELKGICRAISNPYAILMNIPVLQESVSSSEIEGIHTTVETLLEAQIKTKQEQSPASKEALRYRAALHEGFKFFKANNSLPSRAILSIHKSLMPRGGQFKKQGNKITRGPDVIYTPPPPSQANRLMGNWENYIHDLNDKTDPLIKAAISHYQFEAIHPFSDGNGRTGRIMIVLQMLLYGLLDFPVLYISGYLLKNRKKYYSSLLGVTKEEKWLELIKFFLSAFDEQAQTTKEVIMNIIQARQRMKAELKDMRRLTFSADFLDHIFSYPVTHATFMAKKLGIVYQTAGKRLSDLEKAGLLKRKQSGTYKLYYNFQLLDCLKT